MKRISILSIVYLLFLLPVMLSAYEPTEEDFLPIGLTEEEMQRLDEIGIDHRDTRQPDGEVRNPAEWEPSEGVIIRWPLGISIALVAELSEDLMVTTIVGSESQRTAAISAYTAGGVNMDNAQFIIAPTNSIWTRDYGPWFIFEDDSMAIVDHIYNRPRPLDDVIPQVIGELWRMTVYGMDLITAGGNHMSDGLGMSMSTRLVYNENPDKTTEEIDSIMLAYVGNDYTVLDYIESGGIHHIDCWAKFLNPAMILIKDVPVGHPSYNLLNQRAEFLSQQISAWGKPYTIVRIYCPYGTAYTNSIILNNKVFVPTFNNSYDDDALQTYQDAMPGYEVLGFDGSWYDNDAIHCRAMGVPDRWTLFVHHVPLYRVSDSLNQYLIPVTIKAHSGEDLIADSLKIFYSLDTENWDFSLLNTSSEPDSFYGYIPSQTQGTQISYFIRAADNSGRVETHPFIGQPWAHTFTVNTSPEIISPDTLYSWADSSIAYYPEFTDADDSVHTITYSGYPEWLSIVNDSLVGTVPSDPEPAGFTVTVSDDYDYDSQDVVLLFYSESNYAYLPGDVNMFIGMWPPRIIGSDVTYLVNFFRDYPSEPCYFNGFWASADANGDCNIIGSDITRLVNYFRGAVDIEFCPDYTPLWLTPDDLPDEAPANWPDCTE